jgi:hypothetical protein
MRLLPDSGVDAPDADFATCLPESCRPFRKARSNVERRRTCATSATCRRDTGGTTPLPDCIRGTSAGHTARTALARPLPFCVLYTGVNPSGNDLGFSVLPL